MRIEQIEWKDANWLELLMDDEVYYVRINFRNVKNDKEILPYPYGLGFNRLNNAKFKELLPMLESGEAAIVRVKSGE